VNDALLVIDEGTSSTRAVLVEADGTFARVAQYPLSTQFPQPGWVEQDAAEIWDLTLRAAREAAGDDIGRIRAIGITNQRETVVAWDARNGKPLAPAIVWQDRRTAAMCEELKAQVPEWRLQGLTGLLLDPYFSATKIAWLLKHRSAVQDAGPHLRVGTIDSWLVWKLTGGAHLTDATNAARTLLMGLRGGWEEGACTFFGVPRAALPEICDSAGQLAFTDEALFGRAIPITGIAGDQQAAAIGQGCLSPGETKATLGTGAFVLTHLGSDLFPAEPEVLSAAAVDGRLIPPPKLPRSASRMLCTVAWQVGGKRTYALEGSLFVAGQTLQWLRDELGIIATSPQTDAMARSVASNGGVQLVPAFSGLGAPHWRADSRGALFGLTLGTTKAHIARAALESVANQCAELQRAFTLDGVHWSMLRLDGGMAANDFLAQDLADMLAVTVERPANVESTVLGAAILAAVGCGLHATLADAASAMVGPSVAFDPVMDAPSRQARLALWDRAVAATIAMGS
jgi:glycerol kinase